MDWVTSPQAFMSAVQVDPIGEPLLMILSVSGSLVPNQHGWKILYLHHAVSMLLLVLQSVYYEEMHGICPKKGGPFVCLFLFFSFLLTPPKGKGPMRDSSHEMITPDVWLIGRETYLRRVIMRTRTRREPNDQTLWSMVRKVILLLIRAKDTNHTCFLIFQKIHNLRFMLYLNSQTVSIMK